jgi:lysophospholipase L1-like esterase
MARYDSNLSPTNLVESAGDSTIDLALGTDGGPRAAESAVRSPSRWLGDLVLPMLLGSCGVLLQVARDAPTAGIALLGLGLTAFVAAGLQQFDLGRRWSLAGAPLLALVVFVAIANPAIGRTPFVVVAISTTLAFGAMVRWRPAPGWPQRSTPTAVLALPPLVVLQLLWLRHTSVFAAAVFSLAALSGLEAQARFPVQSGRVAGQLERFTSAVATFVATVLVGLAAIILLYLPGAVVRVWMRLFRRRRGVVGKWQVVDSAGHYASSSRRLYARTPVTLRRRRHRVSAAVVLAALALVVVSVQSAPADRVADPPSLMSQQRLAPPSETASTRRQGRDLFALEFATPYSQLPAYSGVPWADQLQIDQAQQGSWDDDVQTRFFNSSDGIRRTIRPACACPRVTVWLSGGSAVVGLGQRDGHTIASELVRIGEVNDLALDVVNVGRSGQTMSGEVARLESLLATTDPPDLIIFLNGWNDVAYRVAFSFAYGPDPSTWANRDIMAALQADNDRPDDFMNSDIGYRAGTDAADDYARLQDQVARLASERGVETAFFFQPDALVDAAQLAGYDDLTNLSASELMSSPFAVALESAAARLAGRSRNLRPEFVGVDQPMFLGLVHQNETGARLTAEAIFRYLSPTVRHLAH